MRAQTNNGEYLQDRLYEAMAEFVKHNKAFRYRFYDTKSTRGSFLPAQPGDFFLLVPGCCFLIECKSSEVGTGLIQLAHKGAVGKNQIAKHKQWYRADHKSFYLYLNIKTGDVSWHSGENVINKVDQPIWKGKPSDLLASLHFIVTLHRSTYDHIARAV